MSKPITPRQEHFARLLVEGKMTQEQCYVAAGFKGGNGKWAYADPVEEARQAAAGPQGGGGMFAGSSISPILQGDAQGNIQSALGKMSAPSDLLQQLLAQLGRG